MDGDNNIIKTWWKIIHKAFFFKSQVNENSSLGDHYGRNNVAIFKAIVNDFYDNLRIWNGKGKLNNECKQ